MQFINPTVNSEFRDLLECPLCQRSYDCHWKVVSHIRKSKDEGHHNFLIQQEEQVVEYYLKNIQKRRFINSMLHEIGNIYKG